MLGMSLGRMVVDGRQAHLDCAVFLGGEGKSHLTIAVFWSSVLDEREKESLWREYTNSEKNT